ncbi:hypothetical protein CXG81DRAFT_13370 [Caulochytrium protostelioides]|uniref:4-aminobutyrate aminotransferase n=1 Tax=Caulochytrium protostelioides TaxID=1555241 RepID=A0A4P9X091_9FUNG|nr:4-aminobutyrate transaminase [Caulochytrium protostelioides]RKP00312.1 hypothetical protein CXG81DRAFT_13370 [Caulochytrium protostelioides]|eukprot:RKP00312.1 hypothetical protein CXG81DRAFT_13370 [Caulochytrium protostelioides]
MGLPSRSLATAVEALFADEPAEPRMHTSAVPGPRSKSLMDGINTLQDQRAVYFVQDIDKSIGNYIADADGNLMLDLYAQIASIAVGYNNPKLLDLARSDKFVRAAMNRPALGVFPPTDWKETLDEAFMTNAPPGLNQVFTAMCGSCANETAFKAAFMYQQAKKRGDADFTAAELASCMKNEAPGSPAYSIMSFAKAFHGRTLASLSATRSKPIHKIDIPALNWPVAPFPEVQYPLEANAAANREAEDHALAETEHLLKTHPVPVAAIIIEPIQGEGGDNMATPRFYQGLRALTQRLGVLMIVDEVQTGMGATGKMWAHEHWNLDTPPDMVTFSKKMQAAGWYHNMAMRASQPLRNFNTWLGDPIRAYQAAAIMQQIREYDLLKLVNEVGDYTLQGLRKLEQQHPAVMCNARGQGTFLAFDVPDPAQRAAIVENIRKRGVNMGVSGHQSVRLRPMLTFQKKHADIFLSRLKDTIEAGL